MLLFRVAGVRQWMGGKSCALGMAEELQHVLTVGCWG